MAALLHDTVEDTDTTLDEIEREFGPQVKSIVVELTDNKLMTRDERKRWQVKEKNSNKEYWFQQQKHIVKKKSQVWNFFLLIYTVALRILGKKLFDVHYS